MPQCHANMFIDVLFKALPLVTVVVGRASGTTECTITTMASVDAEEQRVVFQLPSEVPLIAGKPQWANYVKGVVANFNGELYKNFQLQKVYTFIINLI